MIAAVAPTVEVRGLEKWYGKTHALAGLDFDVNEGEIHGLIGPNGAGKSTLVKILAGVVVPDAGEIRVSGREVRVQSPHVALRHGLAFVHQQLMLAPSLSVLDNVFLGLDVPTTFGRVNRRKMQRRLQPVLERMGVPLPLGSLVETLSVTEQRFAMIARALLMGTRAIAFDEPTASLERAEVEALFRVLRGLRAEGVAVLFISHRLGEVRELCDRVTVLRDGRARVTAPVSSVSHHDLLVHMGAAGELEEASEVDHSREPLSAFEDASDSENALLVVRDITAPRLSRPISFSVGRGEIVGFAGVVGAGRTRLAKTVMGLLRRLSGDVIVDGRRVRGRGPQGAARAGIVFLPDERARFGVSASLTVRENVTLAILDQVYRRSPLGTRRRSVERERVAQLLGRVGLDPRWSETEAGSLSGGMQQRVLFAKILARNARVLILDEPTQGVDVSTKLALHQIMRDLASEGRAIIVISSELEELTALCDRVLCVHEGQIRRELPGAGLTPTRIIQAIWEHQEAAPGMT